MRKFIVLEGLDYAGKSTLAKALVETMNKQAMPTEHVSISSKDNVVLSAVKQMVLEADTPVDVDTQSLLFASSITYMLNNRIVPELEQGKYVVCERFTLSNKVYQEQSLLSNTITSTIETIKSPELTIVLDIPPGEYLKRLRQRGNPDKLESVSIEELLKRRVRYINLARENDDIKILDGALPTNEQVDFIIDLIKTKRQQEAL